MAIKIINQNNTAAGWTGSNPTLAVGIKGVEYDTGKFKVGDGVTAWNSLAYQGATGASQTQAYRSFGDGSDGNVTISSGTTTLSQDMYYNNLTINGTGVLNTNSYKVFVKNLLDLSAAPVGAIQNNAVAAGNASGATGGAQPTAQNANGTLAQIARGGTSASGTTAAGTSGSAGAASNGMGGNAGTGGAGGAGTNAGGTAANGNTPSSITFTNRFSYEFLRGVTLAGGGASSAGGSAGGGDGTNSGGGGGGGGSGGGMVALFANIIYTSSSTPASCIQALGGSGGNGGTVSTGNVGGGGGGGGGAGGWIYIAYNQRAGATVSYMLDTTGGSGGAGGNGNGTGKGGTGGNGGSGGTFTLFNVPTSTAQNFSIVSSVNGNLWIPQAAGSVGVGTIGGNGGMGGWFKFNF